MDLNLDASGEFTDAMWEKASANDIWAELGEMPQDEHDYYLKLLDNG